MIDVDFSYDQKVTTVPTMTPRERAAIKSKINEDFVHFYRDNYYRFREMYDGSITINGRDILYADMLPAQTLAEMTVGG